MTIKEFWEQIDVAVTHCHNCDMCPIKIFADETGTELICCDLGNDCADSLMMLHKKLQEEEWQKMDKERGEDGRE
jgi:hypothetical protein